jgi:hypothetical protein
MWNIETMASSDYGFNSVEDLLAYLKRYGVRVGEEVMEGMSQISPGPLMSNLQGAAQIVRAPLMPGLTDLSEQAAEYVTPLLNRQAAWERENLFDFGDLLREQGFNVPKSSEEQKDFTKEQVAPWLVTVASLGRKLPGVTTHKKLYHGSPSKDLTKISIGKSKKKFMPHVSVTDSSLLAESFTKGEMGNKPAGKVYEFEGDWKIIDIDTDDGRQLWEALGKDPQKALADGFDGLQFKNLEQIKVESFYPDLDWNRMKNAKEIQMFKSIPLKEGGLRENLIEQGFDPDKVIEKTSAEIVKLPEFDQYATEIQPWSIAKRASAQKRGASAIEKIGEVKHAGEIFVKVRDNRSGMIHYVSEEMWNLPPIAENLDDYDFESIDEIDIPTEEESGREAWEYHFDLVLNKEYPAKSSEWKDLRKWYASVAEETGRDFNPKASRRELFDEIIEDGSVNLFDFGPYSGFTPPRKGMSEYFDEDIVEWIFNLMKRYPNL